MKYRYKYISYLELLPALYFIVLSAAYLILDILYTHRLDLALLLLTCICTLPLIINRKWGYILFGACNTLLWGYLLLAISDDCLDYLAGENHYNSPVQYFGVGYSLVIVSLLCSIIMIWAAINRRSTAFHNSKTA